MLNGNLSCWYQDALLARSLTVLRKLDGCIRPTVLVNVFKRFTSNLAIQSVRTRDSEQHRPLQVGFGVAGGAEALDHSARRFINNACQHDIILNIDMRNAFNSLRRDHILVRSTTTCQKI